MKTVFLLALASARRRSCSQCRADVYLEEEILSTNWWCPCYRKWIQDIFSHLHNLHDLYAATAATCLMKITWLYPPLQRSWEGGILVSPCPSVRPSVCGQNCVRSVSSTILVGSISYLHILSSNFRRCVACNVCFKIEKFEILANSLSLYLWLCLLLT